MYHLKQRYRTPCRLMVFGLLLMTVLFQLQAAEGPSTEILPIDIQVDLLVEDLRVKRAAQDHEGVINVISKIRSLDTPFPDFLLWVEAQSLHAANQILAARDRLLAYLRNAGQEGRFYTQAKELLVSITPEAEQRQKAIEEERKKRAQGIARAEQKAAVLRTKDAQRLLDQLGFKVEINGELNKQTQEAVAVYQIRRDLTINGQINDEVIDHLRLEVPDSHICDTLAHYSLGPDDWQTIALARMNAILAISECNDALRQYPSVVRFQIQYARALAAANRAEESVLLVSDLARKEYPAAEFLIGQLHESGQLSENGKPAYKNAMRMFAFAADRGYALAQHHLGRIYETGVGVTRDKVAAINWYRKAGVQGYLPAQLDAGRMYSLGRGISRNYDQALRWYLKAADLGSAEGQFHVGNIYERGKGISRDKKIALEWYSKSAAQGHQESVAKVKRLSR